METYFVEYLLGALDERTRGEVDAYLARHPEAREKLALLKEALAPLEADKEAPEPPPLLVERTLAKIAAHLCAPKPPPQVDDLPQAPPVSPATGSIGRSWWRRADILIAACLLVTIAGVGLIVLGRMRGPNSAALIVECQNNLRQFYVALQTYRDQHGQFPDVSKEAPYNVAGVVVPVLHENGTLPASVSIRCPGVGSPVACQLTLTSLKAMSDADFLRCSPSLSMCYAYSLGYRDDEGTYHGPARSPQTSWSQTPIMADRPPTEGIWNNSVNHGGGGQNVLFADGHVLFMSDRKFGQDDIFVNGRGLVAAGVDPRDVVLGCSSARP